MGAMTALGMAANYPDLVRAAVLEDPPFSIIGNRQRREHNSRKMQKVG
jgi:pimeloyl-ACP methyl ester carboxylesterase